MRRSDKYTLLVALLALALIAVFYVSVHRPRTIPPAVTTALPATPGHYLGVAESNEIANYESVDTFAAAIHRQPNVVLYYSKWGDPFETGLAKDARAHGATTFVQIDPEQSTRMAAVAAGRYDTYLRTFATQIRDWRYPVIVGFAPEMNGDWDSWGWRHTSPATWIAAWKHVVDDLPAAEGHQCHLDLDHQCGQQRHRPDSGLVARRQLRDLDRH